MPNLQPIQHRGRLAAVVLGDDHAVIAEHVHEVDLAIVQSMCVYAIEIAAGDRPGPYNDTAAENHAEQLLATTSAARTVTRHPAKRRRGGAH